MAAGARPYEFKFEYIQRLKENQSENEGDTNVRLGKYESAIRFYTEAIQYRNVPTLYAKRAQCHLKLEKYHDCIEDCDRAIALDPNHVKAYYHEMIAYEKLDDIDNAFENCRFLLELEPQNNELITFHDLLQAQLNFLDGEIELNESDNELEDDSLEPFQTPTEQANQLNNKGDGYALSKKYRDALPYYTEAIRYKKDPTFYVNRALCHLKLAKYKECIQDCDEAIALDPEYVIAYYYQMIAFEKVLDNENAFENCIILLELVPRDEQLITSFERLEYKVIRDEIEDFLNETTQPIESKEDIELKNFKNYLCAIVINGYRNTNNESLAFGCIRNLRKQRNREEIFNNKNIYKLREHFLKYIDKANSLLMFEKYQKAIKLYTLAILIYSFDSTAYASRGECHLQLENYAQCIKDCKKAIQLDRKCAKAYYYLMIAYENLGDIEIAFEICKTLLKLKPRNKQVKKSFNRITDKIVYKGGEIELNESDNELEENTNKLIQILREKGNVLKNEGNRCAELGDYEAAIYFYTKAIKYYKNDPTFYANRAQCHLKMEKYKECIKDCDRAIALDPKYVKAYYRRMIAYEKLDNIKNAFKNCEYILTLEPENQKIITSFERIKNKMNFLGGEIELNESDNELGENAIERIQILREQGNLLKNEGNKCAELGDYEIAIYFYTKAIQYYKNDPTFYANRAQCHLKMEKYKECIEDCDRAIALYPKYVKAYYRRMIAYEKLDNIKNAFKNCEYILTLEPENQKIITSFERIKNKMNFLDMEIENMAGKNIQLIESDMEDPSSSIEDAGHEVNIPMVEYHNAINDLHNWEWKNRMEEQNNQPNEEDGPILIESVPPLSQNCEKISNIIPEQQDNNTESIHELKEKAVKLKEEGNVQVKLGEYGSAIKYYTEAIDIYKNDPTFYANRAQCHLKLENYEECIEDCKEAIELDPKYGKAYYRLMIAYENLGDIENAFRNCRIILELEPKNQQAITSYERIKDKLNLHACEQVSVNDTKLSHIFKSLPKDVEEIDVIDNKPPHLKSKSPLKRIHIVEINDEPDPLLEEIEKIPLVNKIDKAIKEVKNEILTKGSDQVQIHSGSVPQNYSDIDKMLAIDLTPPRDVPEFYSTWKNLTNFQKYLYLKIIEPSDINKFLGHGFNYDTLIEILTTLKDYHIPNGEKIGKLFFNISNHDEVKIIGYFLSRNDQQIISELLDYMQKQNDEVDCIEKIQIKFNLIQK